MLTRCTINQGLVNQTFDLVDRKHTDPGCEIFDVLSVYLYEPHDYIYNCHNCLHPSYSSSCLRWIPQLIRELKVWWSDIQPCEQEIDIPRMWNIWCSFCFIYTIQIQSYIELKLKVLLNSQEYCILVTICPYYRPRNNLTTLRYKYTVI